MRDIWDVNTKTFYTDNYIRNVLIDKTNWRQKYTKIKNNIPDGWVNILKEGDSQPTSANLIIKPNLMIYSKEKYVEPDKIKLKTVHNLFLDETYKPKSQIKWETMFSRTFNWKLVRRSSLEIPCSNKERQVQWKIIHNAIFTEHKLQLMNFSDGLCHFVGTKLKTSGTSLHYVLSPEKF